MSIKKYSFICLLLVAGRIGYSQTTPPYSTLQRVIPPSPEAISIAKVGFTDVSLYTGKPGYSLPLYTVSQNGISFPISLFYTGGGGIKVEEIASSAGLGWSLSSTGMVTRVTRGVADDSYAGNYIGYMHLPDFPPVDTGHYNDYQKYSENKYDGQPDLFSVNAAGLNAQFYIGKDKKVVFVEKSELKITPIFSGYTIIAFSVKDLNGRTYYFSELEKSKSVPIDGSYPEYNDYTTSSWYLTKITSEYGKDIITFTYLSGESNIIKQELRSPHQFKTAWPYDQSTFKSDSTIFSQVFYKRPLLQKISFASGEVNFIMQDSARYDMDGDKYLKSIIVKNSDADTVKQLDFKFSYFSTSGTLQQGQGTGGYFGNSSLRLKLDSLMDISRTGQALTYKFVYDTTHFLPNRMSSFAVDHWGYYNGQSTNTGWEANNRAKYYVQPFPYQPIDSYYVENGTANRKPYLEYAKSGVLTKVITPTGGEIGFDYELNSSADSRLPNTLSTSNFFTTLDNNKNYFHISLINEPFSYVTVSSIIDNSYYSYEYTLADSAGTNGRFPILDTLVYGDASHVYKLESGVYSIKVRRLGAHPDPNYQYFARVFKEDESLVVNKAVGGLRIRAMHLKDAPAGTDLVRNYFYNESGDTSSTSLSTGIIDNPPSYGYQAVELFSTDYTTNYFSPYYIIPHGYARLLTSAYPVGVTAGSAIGYSKVTTIDSNQLRTESWFTTFKDYPEYSDGYFPGYGSSFDEKVINGKRYETSPLTPADERDYLRGKIIKQIIYKKENGSFKKIQQTENTYAFNMGMEVDRYTHMLPDTLEYLPGMVFRVIPNGGNPPIIMLKKFNIYTSRFDLKRTLDKQYTYRGAVMDSLVNQADIYYGDSPWGRDSLFHYQPTKVTKITNMGSEVTKLYYPYDWRYGVPGAGSPELSNMQVLETANRIAIPVLQTVEDSASNYHISSVKNTYDNLVGTILAPKLIQTKDGKAGSFSDRFSFNKYDTLGNLIEQQKTNDIKSIYIWNYKNSYPVAEISNADSSQVAYTSFESDGKGNWSYSGTNMDTVAVTGRRAYKLTGSNGLTKSGLSSGNVYITSYWTRNGAAFSITGTQGSAIQGPTIDGWTYFEHKITGQTSVTINGTGWVDEVRLFPEHALMTTLTYDPLIGVTSQCDANGKVSYFEYDGFYRLAIVRDQYKNVLKRNYYNYNGQTENTTYFYNTSVSNTFTKNTCGSGYTGSNVVYTASANRYGSAVSQTDANKRASNDVSSNGQNYANSTGTCTVQCNSSNCSGANKKCINNSCQTGIKVYTDTYWNSGINKWVCTYHYEWSDGSWSQNYTENSNFACPV